MAINKKKSVSPTIITKILLIVLILCGFGWQFYAATSSLYLNYKNLTNTTSSLSTDNNKSITFSTSNTQETFNKYISYLTSISDYKHMNKSIKIDNLDLKRLSKKSLIESLSNKSISFFGDSLMFYLSSYIIQVLFWCFDDNGLNNTRNDLINNRRSYSSIKLIFCQHLNGNQSTLILDKKVINILNRRSYLSAIVDKFDKYSGSFDLNQISMIHINKYNISIYLFYKWSLHMKSIQTMMKQYKSFAAYSQFDVMISNMFGMHVIHAFPMRIPPSTWNMNISWSLIDNIEYYTNQMITNKQKHQCFIFGAMNPVYHGENPGVEVNYHTFNWFSIIIKLFHFGNIEEKLKNASFIDTYPFKRTFKETQSIISPVMLKYIPHINKKYSSKYQWKQHLSYPIIEHIMNINLTTTEYETISKCKFEFRQFVISEKINLMNYDNLNNNTMENVIVNFCLLYGYGLGQNMMAQRLKDVVKYYKHNKVYYHDQYALYVNFKNLYRFEHSNVHYPAFQPLSWTNLHNLIRYGC